MSKNTLMRSAIHSRVAQPRSGSTRSPIARAVRHALVLSAIGAGAALPALAQQAPPAAADAAAPQLQTVIVTGSLIAAPNEKSTSPIQVITAKDIQTGGKTDIGDIIQQLPQNFTNDLGQDLGNGTSGLTSAGGVSTADLRGLGPNRTLVLVDGIRLGQGSPYTFIQSPAPDLDQIPAGLVERVDVVTGGASATYGSDAIAGVVNFVLRKNFQGVEVNGEFSENVHDNGDTSVQSLVRQFENTVPPTGLTQDGRKREFSILAGTNFADNKGNITAFFSYRHQDPVSSAQRDFGACQLFPTQDANGNVTGLACGGSSNSNLFIPELKGAPGYHTSYSVKGNQFVPFGTAGTTPPVSYNSQPMIYMTREDDRYNAAVLAHEDLADYLQPYAQFFFMDDRTFQAIAPDALFKDNVLDPLGAGYYYTNCGNPLLSAQEVTTIGCAGQAADTTVPIKIGRRNVEGGARHSFYEHENYRAVAGTKGALGDAWSYNAYAQYYYTTFFNRQDGYFNFQSIDNALLVNGTAANPSCANQTFGTIPCAPYNIWQDGGVTQAALNYLSAIGTGQGTSTLRTEHLDVTGYLGQYGISSPFARNGVDVALGVEHRNDHEQFEPDATEQSGLLEGFGSAAVPIDNTVSVTDTFAELRAPLVQDKTGVKDLLFDTGIRHSSYSTSGGVNSYKFEVQFAPIEDYRLRVSFDRAIRAPSVVELYNPQLVGLIEGSDPCAPTYNANGTIAAPAQFTAAQCANQGITAAQYGNGNSVVAGGANSSYTGSIPQGAANQIQQLSGGNPKLQPEVGKTYTIGLNFQPRQIPHLTGSVDYYHIDVTNEVGTLPFSLIMSDCANSKTYCNLIVRNRTTGGIDTGTLASGGYVVQTNLNVAEELVSGIDVQLNYHHSLPGHWGEMAYQLNGSYLSHVEWTPSAGAHTYDCAGLYGYTCQTINPRWHHLFRATWITPWKVSASLTWRYIGSVSEDNNSNDPTLHFATYGGYDYVNASIPGYNYFDVSATWNATDNLEIRAGANNVLDKDPPILSTNVVGGGAANTYSTYDMFGRQVFVAFTARF